MVHAQKLYSQQWCFGLRLDCDRTRRWILDNSHRPSVSEFRRVWQLGDQLQAGLGYFREPSRAFYGFPVGNGGMAAAVAIQDAATAQAAEIGRASCRERV